MPPQQNHRGPERAGESAVDFTGESDKDSSNKIMGKWGFH